MTTRPAAVGPAAPRPRPGARGFWPVRDLPTVLWLLATVAVVLAHPVVPAPRWLMIHLLVLGAVGHAILVWSRYFADTLLRCAPAARGPQTLRLVLFNAGVLTVVLGVPAQVWLVTLVGASAVAVAAGWHGVRLALDLRTALGSRFAPVVRYYVAAAALLPVGAALGVWLAHGLVTPLHEQARAAHVAVNVLGWMGLTVLGTVLTLWPTMLRTRIPDGAQAAARRALPLLVVAVLSLVASALAGLRLGYAAGLTLYLVGVGLLAVPAARAGWAKPPRSFAAWSVLAGLTWLVGCLAVLVLRSALASSWTGLDAVLAAITPLLAAGFAAQVLVGASSYLVPVVLGGGPASVRAADRVLDSGSEWRLVVANAGLGVCALPVPSLVRVIVSVLVVAALACFLPLLVLAIRASRRVRRAPQPSTRPPVAGRARPDGQHRGLAVSGLAVVLVAVAGGTALDPAALGRTTATASAGVPATGRTTSVEVRAQGMRFVPSTVQVPAGDRLVITVRNPDRATPHDLVLQTGATTGRIAPSGSGTVDVGVVGRDLEGWCSVVGHRQMGMVLTVRVVGGDRGTAAPAAAHDHGAHRGKADGPPPLGSAAPASPGTGFQARDAALPPLEPGRVHRRTMTVRDTVREVAPGIWQTLWTYDGTAPGPTLHGRVGDVFEITLVNRASIGHSVDFHAGALAPGQPMRTIAPGQRLVYRFTARRAGVWMYHCSTMPMSAHIANGLFGAVVVEPADLPPVARSYLLVQSELYLGPQRGEVDVPALQAERPDAVVFNGYANQYDHDPLPARVGERVRVWVLAAGPNRGAAFHVVGGQFDRVWSEGAWQLGDAASPALRTGAQTLGLTASQGGFVELTFPEPGRYPFVNHVMVDAERGAHGLFDVTR